MTRCKPITQYGADGVFLRSFDSRTEAAAWLRGHGHPKATHAGMSRLGDGITYGYRWRDGRHGGPITVTAGRPHKRPILRFLDGHPDRRYDSLSEAARDLVRHGHPKAQPATISNVIRSPRRRAYGYQWRYEDEWDGMDLETYAPRKRPPRRRPKYPRKAVDTRKKPVIGTDAAGDAMRFESISAAARYLRDHGRPEASGHAISDAAQGYANTAYGRTWKYEREDHREPGNRTVQSETTTGGKEI